MQWFEEEALWLNLYPFLFPEDRIQAATAEVEQIIKLTGCNEGDVLDLCCGPGRHSLEFARRGFKVTGVDRTGFLLEKAREASNKQKLDVDWVLSDMREFEQLDSYDLALSMFSSFGYFIDDEDNVKVLKSLYDSLKLGGQLVMDLKGKETFVQTFLPAACSDGPDGSILVQRHKIADDWNRIDNQWILIKGGQARIFDIPLRIYGGEELRMILKSAGFTEVKLYGSLDGSEYGLSAGRLIAVATKGLEKPVDLGPKEEAPPKPIVPDPEPIASPKPTAPPAPTVKPFEAKVVEPPPPPKTAEPPVTKPEPAPPAPVAEPVTPKKAAPPPPPAAPEPATTSEPTQPSRQQPTTPSKFFGKLFTPAEKKAGGIPKPSDGQQARPWWHSVTEVADDQIALLDGMEEGITPLDDEIKRIRIAMSRLRMWHYDAYNHVKLLIIAISKGSAEGTDIITQRTRDPQAGEKNETERLWHSYIDVLSAWCMGNMSTIMYLDQASLGNVNPIEMLGVPSQVKMWQVRQVIAKIRTSSGHYPSAEYVDMVGSREHYLDVKDFYDRTLKTTIHDLEDHRKAELSLASAIDQLDACNWNFLGNIQIILKAINGYIHSDTAFASATRNIKLSPIRDDMKNVANTLRWFAIPASTVEPADASILNVLGEATPSKQWLAGSLDKTVCLQLQID